MIFRLIQISENINKVSIDFKLIHQEVPWHSIKGFRNRLVHEYGSVDLKFVYDALIYDIPKLEVILFNAMS